MPIQSLIQATQRRPRILPSLLLCNFGDLRSEVAQMEAAGIKALHLDVMDGHFVPNITYGMTIIDAVRGLTDLPLDVHLMITSPRKYLKAFRESGADHITIHAEATDDLLGDLELIHESGASAGVAINPATSLQSIAPAVGHCELVLVMTVDAGFGGQTIHDGALAKLPDARTMFGSDVRLEIDGGVGRQNIAKCVAAGAELLVVGSAIFRQPDYAVAIRDLETAIAAGA